MRHNLELNCKVQSIDDKECHNPIVLTLSLHYQIVNNLATYG